MLKYRGKAQLTGLSLISKIYKFIYRKPTADCQTKATNKKNSGIIGKTSTKGENGAYASGKVKTSNIIFKIQNFIYTYSILL